MIELFLAELKRSWIEFLRYSFEAVVGILITSMVFYGLFLSARYIAGPALQFGDRLDAIVVGYVLWTLVVFIEANIAGGLQSEAQTGTLEQLFISPFGASRVFLVRAIASLTLQISINMIVLLIIILLTGSQLSFPPTLVLPFLTVILGAYGVAFIMGSLALVLKRVQQLLGIVQFALLFLLTIPVETWTGSLQRLGWLLPMAPGAGLLRGLMARGEGLHVTHLAIAFVNGSLYLMLGLYLFRWAERVTKYRGRLGGY
ncbi:ABC transporter permease [Oculatella sp. LEGE 06141]|uniref:ABC transporter permease n=1 Tax=Oculatella sp. LEGE 06141 TaxID=1828648 RepID=UPI00187FBCBA|nr:ABC transporter permease [Oculatella sp. LEGE 06141]MBE9177121.1 ABC transporter permease [Oculatella sp. LEGE 06141]